MSQHDVIWYFGKCFFHSLASQRWHKVEAYLPTETVLLLYLFTPLRNLQGHVLLPLAKLLFVYPINFVKKYRENYFAPAVNQQMLFLWLGRDILLAWDSTTRSVCSLVEHELLKPALNW